MVPQILLDTTRSWPNEQMSRGSLHHGCFPSVICTGMSLESEICSAEQSRRMQTYISNTSHWKSYDIYARSKNTGFVSSRAAVVELAAQYKQIVTQLQQASEGQPDKKPYALAEAEQELFIEMCEICLWGNKTDLSLLPTMDHDLIQQLQGSKVRKASEKKILVNDLSKAFQVLSAAKTQGKSEIRVDFVLDNAGFELFVDLILAGYLLAAGLATTVVLHPKTIPWFVSDVTPTDFALLLNALQNGKSYFSNGSEGDSPLSESELDSIAFLFDHWANLHIDGQLIVRPHGFWTEGGSFWRLPATAPELYEDLKESELVIFKGDLNYRKLIADVSLSHLVRQANGLQGMWPADTPFEEALGPIGAKSGLRILSLRTCKGDAVVGLPPGKDEELRKSHGGDPGAREWAWGGEWAVCQFYDGRD
jgi:damage-control phosphatase, subfamily III